jgi:pimeloyl-ACP methyl ester carboxylesterase
MGKNLVAIESEKPTHGRENNSEENMNILRSSVFTKSKTAQRELPFLNRIGRALVVLVASLPIVVAVAWGYDTYVSLRVTTLYPPPGQFLQIGNAKMHYICEGTGEPTLVLIAGIPGGALNWAPVQPALAAHHRVCAFDRLGQDWSDPAPHPRTFTTAVDELHSALQQIGIEHPVVVGHSFGGALVQVYAAKYDVAGVVLVDGMTTGMVDVIADLMDDNKKWDGLARFGLMRPVLNVLAKDPFYTPDISKKMVALRSRSGAWLSMSDEGAVAQQTMAADLRAAEQKLDMPMLIIAAGRSNVMNLGVGAFAKSAKELSERKPNSTYILVPDAKHYIQAEQPQVVIEAIETWLTTLQ